MARAANVSLCITDLPRGEGSEKYYKRGKDGKNYLNLGMYLADEKNQFGQNVSMFIGQTKEEQEAKEPRIYLGNGWWNEVEAKSAPAPSTQELEDDTEDLPF